MTGAGGFIGSALVKALADRGERVVALARRPPLFENSQIRWVHADLRSDLHFPALLDGVTTIYHLAWSSLPASSNEDPVGDAADNILGTLRILEAVKTRPGIRFVFASSGGTVYGRLETKRAQESHPTRPICAYGVSKLAVENYLSFYNALWDLDFVVLRIGNAYGPGQGIIRNFGAVSTFISRALNNQTITIYGDGSIVRDYVYISDIVAALITASERRDGPFVLNIGNGIGYSLNQVLQLISEAFGRSFRVHYTSGRNVDVPFSVLDIRLAETTLGWYPRVTLAQGIGAILGMS